MLRKEEELGREFSKARTFFPERLTTAVRREKAGKDFLELAQREKSKIRLSFWLEELPHLMYIHRKSLWVSLLVFTVSFGVGVFSSVNDPNFGTAILGKDYVEMTLQNIALGDPLAVYKQKDRFEMAAGITANNFFVSLLSFALGIMAGLGTIGLLISNGVMVGVFQSLFIAEGLFYESFLTIWTHGLPEMAAMIIAGGAGLTMGSGWLFPGRLSRMESFRLSARDGLKILAGIIPVLVFAGFAEGYLTRYTDAPDGLRWSFILICLFFLIFYFVWYPSFRSRFFKFQRNEPRHSGGNGEKSFERFAIHSNETLVRQSFQGINGKGWSVLGLALLYTILYFIWGGEPVFPDKIFGAVSTMNQFYSNFLQAPFLALVVYIFGSSGRFSFKKMTGLLIIWGLVVAFIRTGHPGIPFLMVLVLPLAFLWGTRVMKKEDIHPFSVLSLMRGQLVRVIGLQLNLLFIGFIFFALFDAWMVKFALNQILANVLPEGITRAEPVLTFLFTAILFGWVGWMSVAFGLMEDVLTEIREAPGLKQRATKIWLFLPVFLMSTGNFDKEIWEKQKEEMRYFDPVEEPKRGEYFYFIAGTGILIGLWWLVAEIKSRKKGVVVMVKPVEVMVENQEPVFSGHEGEWEVKIRKAYASFLGLMKKNRGWNVSLGMSNRQIQERIQDDRLKEIHRLYEEGFYGKKSSETAWKKFENEVKKVSDETG
jgi:uncharacterized membrane protein SpoIIM required for sporulation